MCCRVVLADIFRLCGRNGFYAEIALNFFRWNEEPYGFGKSFERAFVVRIFL